MSTSNSQQNNDTKKMEEYFMGMAYLSGMRSKDSNTQVGACVVNENNEIVGVGYNGMPNRCIDDEMPWGRNEDKMDLDSKYPYVCHAEMNAIVNANEASVKDCDIYVTMFPCNDCAKLIVQSEIKRVYYNNYKNKNTTNISNHILEQAGLEIKAFDSNNAIDICYHSKTKDSSVST